MRRVEILLLALLASAAAGAAHAAAPFQKAELYRKGRQFSKGGDFVRAAAAFEDVIRAESGHHTLQLAVICEASSIARLVDAMNSEEGFYFVATEMRGRPCFKALWGVYGTPEEAQAAIGRVPAELRDPASPPLVLSVAKLLAIAPPPPPAARVATAGTRPSAAPPAGKAFTDADLANYRKQREAEEAKFGKPKPLFETRPIDSGSKARSAGAAKGQKAAKERPLPPPTTVTAPPPGDEERAYWASLIDTAKQTVAERQAALGAARKAGDPQAIAAAEQGLEAAQAALEDLRKKAKDKGADPAWLR